MRALALLSMAGVMIAAPAGAEPPAAKPPKGAVVLFDGKDASAWALEDGKPCPWKIVDGAMEVGGGGSETKQKFQDGQFHVEFRIPDSGPDAKGQGRGNSGVYLQHRYEIQVLDSYGIEKPGTGDCGAVYGQKPPDCNASKKPEEWQSYDITFRAARFDGAGKKIANARVTVLQNGVKIHDDVEIKDRTGAGREETAEPGPLFLQDHGHPVRYRNIWVVPGAGKGAGGKSEGEKACACGGACKCGHCSSGGQKACKCK